MLKHLFTINKKALSKLEIEGNVFNLTKDNYTNCLQLTSERLNVFSCKLGNRAVLATLLMATRQCVEDLHLSLKKEKVMKALRTGRRK